MAALNNSIKIKRFASKKIYLKDGKLNGGL